MCFGTSVVSHTSPATGFVVEEGCGGFYLTKVTPATCLTPESKQEIGWFETRQAAIDASYKN